MVLVFGNYTAQFIGVCSTVNTQSWAENLRSGSSPNPWSQGPWTCRGPNWSARSPRPTAR